MENKNTYLWITALIIIAVTFWYMAKGGPDNEIVASFTSETGESVLVIFDNENQEARLDGAGYDGVVLTQASSTSGARYVNEGESLELWSKVNEVIISKGGEIIFSGEVLEVGAKNKVPEEEAGAEIGLYIFSGPTWVWKETRMNDGRIVRPNKPGEFSVRFDQNGKVTGNTDCNNFGGTYTTGASNTLSFGPFMSNLMFCEDSQETEFVRMVADSTQYTFTPNGDLVLMIKFDSGSVIFEKK